MTPLVLLAVGRRDDTVQLAEPFAAREAAVRERLPLESLLLDIDPAESLAA